jgi:hypothetical protein
MHLSFLKNGSPFKFIGTGDVFRDMFLLKAGDSRCKIIGRKRISKEIWQDFEDDCSPGSEVDFDASRQEIKIDENEFGICSVNKTDKIKIETIKTPKTPKQKLDIPFDFEFTVKQLAEKLGVEIYTVANELSRRKKANPECLKVVKTVSGGRGKPQCVFKLVK